VNIVIINDFINSFNHLIIISFDLVVIDVHREREREREREFQIAFQTYVHGEVGPKLNTLCLLARLLLLPSFDSIPVIP